MLVTDFRNPTGEVVMANYATWPIQCVQNGIKAQWYDLQARQQGKASGKTLIHPSQHRTPFGRSSP